MHEIYLESGCERDLKKLPAKDFQRVIGALRSLGENPRSRNARKIVGSKSDWRIRVGFYRIIYEIDDREKAVRVMKIKQRKEAYR